MYREDPALACLPRTARRVPTIGIADITARMGRRPSISGDLSRDDKASERRGIDDHRREKVIKSGYYETSTPSVSPISFS